MNRTKIAILVLATIGLTSCFMPWANHLFFGKGRTISGLQYSEGIFCLVYFSLVVVGYFLTSKRIPWSINEALGVAVSSLLPALITVYKIFEFQSHTNKIYGFNIDVNNFVLYEPAMGLYLATTAVAGIFLMMMGDILWKKLLELSPANTGRLEHKINFLRAGI